MGKTIAIIDSGVKKGHPANAGKEIKGFSLFVNEHGRVCREESFEDLNGHGTAIFSIISKEIDSSCITNIRIYDDETTLMQDDLELILEYICEECHFDVINMSFGIVSCGPTDRIQNIVSKMHSQGTLIVSAFDNSGGASIPAMLDDVVGVDADDDLSEGEYIEIKGSIVNVVGPSTYVKVAWLNPEYILVKGTSFLTAQIAALLTKQDDCDFSNAVSSLCTSVIDVPKAETHSMPFSIEKAVVFPFNKEVHAMARFERMIPFEIVDYYSLRIMGIVGKKISDLIAGYKTNKKVKDILKIEWDAFDTLILGHTDACAKISRIDIRKELIEEAGRRGKNIYSFDGDKMEAAPKEKSFWPKISENNIQKRFGKLYQNNVPIVSIVGTNSKQGKFTLQLMLRERLTKVGYNVGQIGTEPTSLLFGMDEMVACGYNSSIDLTMEQIYMYMNQIVHNIVEKDVDIIMFGAQTALLGYNTNNVFQIPLEQRVIYEAIKADATILCINSFDDEDYIRQTIELAEGLSGGKVIALACYPALKECKWSSSGSKLLSEEQRNEMKLRLSDYKLFWTDRDSEIDDLVDTCIDYFTE